MGNSMDYYHQQMLEKYQNYVSRLQGNNMTRGYCPHCNEPTIEVERRPNGNCKCKNGHIYACVSELRTPKLAEKILVIRCPECFDSGVECVLCKGEGRLATQPYPEWLHIYPYGVEPYPPLNG